jgi:hypothetical protein
MKSLPLKRSFAQSNDTDNRLISLSCLQAKLVKQEQQAIDSQYEKKRKGAEVSQKMYVVFSMLTTMWVKLKSFPALIPP